MAGFRMHITVSTVCGVGTGVAAVKMLGHPVETGFLVGCLTAVGGMLPDLDSDSGVPVREMSGLAATVIPLLLYNRLSYAGMTHEGILALLAGTYLLIRYGAAYLFKYVTVHRGMFHSIPAMLIAGLSVYLAYDTRTAEQSTRYLLGIGVMIGFLSHLVLDEIYSVDFNGIRIKLKSSAGSALKFFSQSVLATTVCYGLLGALGFLAYADYQHHDRPPLVSIPAR
jgi:membrane-bound metal-dependent hydrolase YbcI (DUF457 family)